MSWLSNTFNKLSYPSKISALTATVAGRVINDLHGKQVTEYNSLSYYMSIYAKRNYDNSYDIKISRHGNGDVGTSTLEKNIPLHKAVREIGKYDKQITQQLEGSGRDIKRKRHNVERIRTRLVEKGILKH